MTTREEAEKLKDVIRHLGRVVDGAYGFEQSLGYDDPEVDLSKLILAYIAELEAQLGTATRRGDRSTARAARYKRDRDQLRQQVAELGAEVEILQDLVGDAYQFVGRFLYLGYEGVLIPTQDEIEAMLDRLARTSPATEEGITKEEHEHQG